MDRATSIKAPSAIARTDAGAISSRVCAKLAGWTSGQPVPRGFSRDLLRRALADADGVLAPADNTEFATAMDRFFDFADTFGVKYKDRIGAIRFYVEALADLPADLLDKAVASVVRNYVYGHRLPPPAELRAVVTDELCDRIARRHRLRQAASGELLSEAPPPASPEQRERMAKQLRALGESLRALPDRHAPRHDR